MGKNHPGRQFMFGAMLGSTIGAISAMFFTKKGPAIHKSAMKKMHEFEGHVKRIVRNKGQIVKTIKKMGKKTIRSKGKIAKRIKKMGKIVRRKRSR